MAKHRKTETPTPRELLDIANAKHTTSDDLAEAWIAAALLLDVS
jgi:hypothetical protein